MILSSLIDYAVLLFPPVTPTNLNPEQLQLLGLQQTVSVTSQLIDRGIIPMVGLAFLFAGFWIDSNSGTTKKGLSGILQPGALALSVLLGIAFLALTFVNVNSQRLLNQRTLEQISQTATQAETQLKDRSQQVAALAQDSQRLSQLEQALSIATQGLSLNGNRSAAVKSKASSEISCRQLNSNWSSLSKTPKP